MNYTMLIDRKILTVRVDSKLHKELKVQSVQHDETIYLIVERAIAKYIKSNKNGVSDD